MKQPDYQSPDGAVQLYHGDCMELFGGLPWLDAELKWLNRHLDNPAPPAMPLCTSPAIAQRPTATQPS